MAAFPKSAHLAAFALLLLAPLGVLQAAGAGRSAPNLIFILADDLGWADTTLYGQTKFYKTPNLERLAKRGMLFTRAYAASPLCSPTRASILTGQSPARLGLTTPNCHRPPVVLKATAGKSGAPDKKSVEPNPVSRLNTTYFALPEALKTAGYATGHFGKWHLGPEPYSPLQQGFDVDVPHWPGPGPAGSYVAPWKFKDFDADPGVPHQHIEDRMAKEAVAWMEKHKDEPFFLNYWMFSVHAPFDAKKALIEKYRGQVDPSDPQRSPTYAAMVESMDDAVGTLLDTLDRLRIADRTLVVFFSDNGGNMYDEVDGTTPTSNAPLRGGKATVYEGGVRVPCVIAYPGVVAAGSKSDAVIQSSDFYPTFLELLGLKAAPNQRFDGVSIVPAMKGEPLTREAIFTYFPHSPPVPDWVPPAVTVHRGDWKLIRLFHNGENGAHRWQLFNLRDDLGEKNDLAANEPDRVKAMDGLIEKFLADTKAVVPTPNPKFDPAKYNPENEGKAKAREPSKREAPPAARPKSAESRPNVLFIYVEDLGYFTSERAAREPLARIAGLKTPHLDALAAQSVNFTRAFCGQSVCSPSKGAILSGRLPHSNGMWRNVHNAHPKHGGPQKWIPLPNPLTPANDPTFLAAGGMHEDIPNLVQRLKAGGVHCALSGKLHVQPARAFPYDAFVPTGDLDAVIKGAGDKPWFFWCNPEDTHAPWWQHARKKLADPNDRNSPPTDVDPAAIQMLPWMPDTPAARIDLAQYYSCVRIIDDFVGAMMRKLEASGQAERTLVVLTGDHGIPYARGKTSVYPAGTHVPLFIKGPGVQTGRRIETPVSQMDFNPTFLETFGLAPIEGTHARSLWPILSGKADALPDRSTVMTETNLSLTSAPGQGIGTAARAVCDGRFYFIANLIQEKVTGPVEQTFHLGSGHGEYGDPGPQYGIDLHDETIRQKDAQPLPYELLRQLCMNDAPPEELYDLAADPWAVKNLIADPAHADTLARLRQELADWRAATGDRDIHPKQIPRRANRRAP